MDANGCSYDVHVSISEPPLLSASAEAHDVTCSGLFDGSVIITAFGGTPPYSGDGEFSGLGEGSYTYTVYDANQCSADVQFTINGEPCDEFCSYTQGFYGNWGGKTCDGIGKKQLLFDLFLSGPLVIGYGSRTLTILPTEISCLISKMPAGGTPNYLPLGNVTCVGAIGTPYLNLKNGKFRNVLIGQTIALGLNIRLNPTLGSLPLTDIYFTTSDADACENGSSIPETQETFNIPQAVLDCLGENNTVNDLFALANLALGNALPEGCLASLSQITGAADAINRGFDGCRMLGEFSNINASILNEEIKNNTDNEIGIYSAKEDENRLSIYPNPFECNTTIEVEVPKDSHIILEIYSYNGSKVSTLINEYLKAGNNQKIEFNSSNFPAGLYLCKLTSGDKVFYSKMIQNSK